MSNKQDTLAVFLPSEGSSLLNGTAVKGLNVNAPITLTDANNTLTVRLDKVSLANDFEVAFNTIAPLQKNLNLQTGNFELKIDPTSDMTIWNANVTDELAVDTMRANGANQMTINDNVTITGN